MGMWRCRSKYQSPSEKPRVLFDLELNMPPQVDNLYKAKVPATPRPVSNQYYDYCYNCHMFIF